MKKPLLNADYLNAEDAASVDCNTPRARAAPLRQLGLLAMLGSALLFSIMSVLVKCLTRFGPFELVFWRSLFMFCGTTTMLVKQGEGLWGARSDRPILIARGVAGFGFMGAFYYAIKVLSLSDAIVITYTSPVIIGVAAALLLGEPWGRLDALGSLLCMAGVLLISKPSFVMRALGVVGAAPPPQLAGVLGALIAAFLSASVYLLLRRAKHLCPVVSTSYFALAGAALSPLFSYLQGESFVWPQGVEWLELALLAGLSIFGQILQNVGLAHESAGKATAMNYVQVVFAYAFQIMIFHRPTDPMSTIGAVMIASWGCIALIKEANGVPVHDVHVAVAHSEDLPKRSATVPVLQVRTLGVGGDEPRRASTLPCYVAVC